MPIDDINKMVMLNALHYGAKAFFPWLRFEIRQPHDGWLEIISPSLQRFQIFQSARPVGSQEA